MLQGKTVLLGVSGSIAAYKTASLASALKKLHADVQVMMTENATKFISPITFEALTGNKCLVDTFDRNFQYQVEHISLARRVDLVMIAPATANIIGKIAQGIADDMLTTTIMACQCPVYLAPAMNTRMFANPIVQRNLQTLRSHGYQVISPEAGYLACGDTGEGKMPEPELLLAYIQQEIAFPKDLQGKRILVTAGPTQEAIDPVRYITNHSTGKMGYALAERASMRGASVTLITGQTSLRPWPFVKVVEVNSAEDMFQAVTAVSDQQEIIIKAAAVADYRPVVVSDQKVKKKDDELTLQLTRTKDILQYLGSHKKKGQILCGFAMETEELIGNARAKLEKKNLDLIAANNLKVEGAGFKTDTNVLTLITKEEEIALEKMAKEEAAGIILDQLLAFWTKENRVKIEKG